MGAQNNSGIPTTHMLSKEIFEKMADDVVLSFHDSLLRESDLSLLEEGRWLNDRLIGFAFE